MMPGEQLIEIVREIVNAGWTVENDATGQFDRLVRQADRLLRQIDNPPLVIVNITDGVEQWTITCAGVGNPEVYLFDFDDEMDTEDMADTLERWEEVVKLASGRVPEVTLANMNDTTREWWEMMESRR